MDDIISAIQANNKQLFLDCLTPNYLFTYRDKSFIIQLINAIQEYDRISWLKEMSKVNQCAIIREVLENDNFEFIEQIMFFKSRLLFFFALKKSALNSLRLLASKQHKNYVRTYRYAGASAVEIACNFWEPLRHGTLKVIKWLLYECECDANELCVNFGGQTVLYQALKEAKSLSLIKCLMHNQAKVKALSNDVINHDLEKVIIMKWLKTNNWTETIPLLTLKSNYDLRPNPKLPKTSFYNHLFFNETTKEMLQQFLVLDIIQVIIIYLD